VKKIIAIEIGRHYWGRWYHYIIPKRLTLKCNPPVYKWLWFYVAPKKEVMPKHTQCENCPDDLEDYVWVYCDKCWQGLCADADKLIVKNRELKQARPQVDEKFIEKYAEEIFSDIYRPLFPLYAILKRMLQEANVEIKEEK
jgi:hypothetical protein